MARFGWLVSKNQRWLLIKRYKKMSMAEGVLSSKSYSLVIAGSTVKVTVTDQLAGVKTWLHRIRWYIDTHEENLVIGVECAEGGGNNHLLSLAVGSRILVYSITSDVADFPNQLATLLGKGKHLFGMDGMEGFGSLLVRFGLPQYGEAVDLGNLNMRQIRYMRQHLSRGAFTKLMGLIRRVARDGNVWNGGRLTNKNIRNVASKAALCFQIGIAWRRDF